MKDKPYLPLIGSLIWLAITVRPDIAFQVYRLGRFSSCPSVAHWKAAKRVLRYVITTKHHGLVFRRASNNPRHGRGLVAYSDSDWAAERNILHQVLD